MAGRALRLIVTSGTAKSHSAFPHRQRFRPGPGPLRHRANSFAPGVQESPRSLVGRCRYDCVPCRQCSLQVWTNRPAMALLNDVALLRHGIIVACSAVAFGELVGELSLVSRQPWQANAIGLRVAPLTVVKVAACHLCARACHSRSALDPLCSQPSPLAGTWCWWTS